MHCIKIYPIYRAYCHYPCNDRIILGTREFQKIKLRTKLPGDHRYKNSEYCFQVDAFSSQSLLPLHCQGCSFFTALIESLRDHRSTFFLPILCQRKQQGKRKTIFIFFFSTARNLITVIFSDVVHKILYNSLRSFELGKIDSKSLCKVEFTLFPSNC